MITLREGEFVVSAYCSLKFHYAMTNFGILWKLDLYVGKWYKAI
jgi:hypothetical protein